MNELVTLTDAIERVRAIHTSYGIFEECSHKHEVADEPHGVFEVDDIGLTCNLEYEICASCCIDNGSQTEICAESHAHGKDFPRCATIQALDGIDAPPDESITPVKSVDPDPESAYF